MRYWLVGVRGTRALLAKACNLLHPFGEWLE